MDRPTLQMAMVAVSDRKAVAAEVAKQLGMTTTTLYYYVNGDSTPKAHGQGDPRRKTDAIQSSRSRSREERQAA